MKNKKMVPYSVIVAAKEGDPDAINTILSHYDSYIDHHSRRTLYDEYGNAHSAIDPEIKQRIRTKIIDRIIHDFNPFRLPEGEILEE